MPSKRLQELLNDLNSWRSRQSYCLTELRSLLGKLSFVTVCVRPGRIFMSRLLNNLHSFPSSRRSAAISPETRLDIERWLTFLLHFNGVSCIKPNLWSFDDLHFTTDACLHGGGAACLEECLSFVFPIDAVQQAAHITALELFVVVVAVRVWAPLLAHQHFILSCDNEAAVTVINSGSTRDQLLQGCLCQLWFTASLHDLEIQASFIPGEHNVLADALSRWNLDNSYHSDFDSYCTQFGLQYTFVDVPDHTLLLQVA